MFLRQSISILPGIVRQYDSDEKIKKQQENQIYEMLKFCYQHIPYYMNKEVYNPENWRGISSLKDIPIITKDILRTSNKGDFQSPFLKGKGIEYTTSGSTGIRINGVHDQKSHDYHTANCFRRFHATKAYRPTYRLSHVRPYKTKKCFYENFGLFRRHVVPSDQPTDKMLEQILENRPHILITFNSYIRDIMRIISKEQLELLKRNLKAIFTESELLTEEHRKYIEDFFQVPVFDEYSAFEVLNIYYECSHHKRHIAEDRIYLEIVDDEGNLLPDGSEGNILVTHFRERGTPLIRYKIGDIGKINVEKCSCGRNFRTMEITAGRSNDIVILPGNRRIYPNNIVVLSMKIGQASECFVKQEKDGSVKFYYIPNSRHNKVNDLVKAEIRKLMYELAGCEFPLEIIETENIPRTDIGKRKLVVSEMKE